MFSQIFVLKENKLKKVKKAFDKLRGIILLISFQF